MILGHDFHSEEGYKASAKLGYESETQPTWRNLLQMLKEAQVDPSCCFFTNVFMGLRRGAATTGRFPGATDAVFVAHCLRFLREQLTVQRPSLIIVMGLPASRLLGRLSTNLEDWAEANGFADLDASGPVRPHLCFPNVDNVHPVAIAITHPCMRNSNVRHRKYRGLVGADAERAMLSSAIATVPRPEG
jgi:hypothetical protein